MKKIAIAAAVIGSAALAFPALAQVSSSAGSVDAGASTSVSGTLGTTSDAGMATTSAPAYRTTTSAAAGYNTSAGYTTTNGSKSAGSTGASNTSGTIPGGLPNTGGGGMANL